jgi:hypothetical protein
MAKATKTETTATNQDELFLLEQRKTKALEKIANSLDALTIWFEEINKDEWSDRLQYYLAEFHTKFIKNENSKDYND